LRLEVYAIHFKEVRMATITRILVPTDLSEHSLVAVDYARRLAARFNARITLLYIIDALPVMGYPMPVEIDTGSMFTHARETAAIDLKLLVAERLGDDELLEREVTMGNPFEEIVRRAEDGSFDLIVMATHGRTGLKHVLLGSVTEKVVRFSPIPVLTVKPESMRMPRERELSHDLHVG
jgi:universal stress protein A